MIHVGVNKRITGILSNSLVQRSVDYKSKEMQRSSKMNKVKTFDVWWESEHCEERGIVVVRREMGKCFGWCLGFSFLVLLVAIYYTTDNLPAVRLSNFFSKMNADRDVLSTNVIPTHYHVKLTPNLDTFIFKGHSVITYVLMNYLIFEG